MINTKSLGFAFSLNKQSDVTTPIADALIKHMVPTQNFGMVMKTVPVRVHDRGWYKGGRGTSFNEELAALHEITAMTRAASGLNALWAFSQVMGVYSSTYPLQAGALTNPNTWSHRFEPPDPTVAANVECNYTTIVEEIGGGTGDGHRREAEGAWIDQVTLRISLDGFISIEVHGWARQVNDVATPTLPALATERRFLPGLTTFNFGPDGAPTDHSQVFTEIVLTFNRNAFPVRRAGQTVGEDRLIDRAQNGDFQLSGSITMEYTKTIHDHFLDRDDIEFNVKCDSEDVSTPDNETDDLTVTVNKARIASVGFGEEETNGLITLNFTPESIMIPTGAADVTAEITTDQDDSEVLVNG